MLRSIICLPLLFACEKDCPTQAPCPKVDPPVAIALADAASGAAPAGARLDQLKQFVRLGYGDEPQHGLEVRSLQFRTEAVSTKELQELVRLVPSYNAFNGPAIAKGLEALRGKVMYWEFGREASPVLYVYLPYWLKQQEINCPDERCSEGSWGEVANDRQLTSGELAALVTLLKTTFTTLQADEIDVDNISDHVYRIWWD